MASPYATPWAWQQGGGQTAPGGARIDVPWRFGQPERVTFSNSTTAMAPPSLLDPMLYQSGGRLAASSRLANSRPVGSLWQSASAWISRMPALVGR